MLVKGVHGVHSSEAYRWTAVKGGHVSKGWCSCECRVDMVYMFSYFRLGFH